jgi:hypothetical protein
MIFSPIGSSIVANPRKLFLTSGFQEMSRIFGRVGPASGRRPHVAASARRSSCAFGAVI